MSMLWQRFTERAKRVVIAAQEEAAHAGEPYVSPEDVVLGLVKESDSVATKVLERLGVAPERVRREIERRLGVHGGRRLNNNDVTLDPRTKHVLDFAYDEARQLKTNYIGTEHLLLGILREGEGIAFETLTELGVDIISARNEAASILGEKNVIPVSPETPGNIDAAEETPKGGGGMLWQRFTERAKRVVIAAQEVAANAGEPYVSPEHLMLGLINESDSVATKVLERLGVSTERARQEIERGIGERGYGKLSANDVTLDPRMKRVLDFAYDESRQSNTNYVGTEHLLLGIIREGDGISYRVLSKLGVDIVAARKEVVSYLGGESAAPVRREARDRQRGIVKRLPQRANYDRSTIHAILDEAFVCHLGFVVDGDPYVIPTNYARDGDRLILHGSPASRMLKTLREGVGVCVTVTILDGLVLARSAFHHSVNYRSVVLFGKATVIDDPEEKKEALRLFVEHVAPGRSTEARPPNDKELKQTLVLALAIEEVSAKIRTGPPVDDEEDYALPVWAGVIPLKLTHGDPIPDERPAQSE